MSQLAEAMDDLIRSQATDAAQAVDDCTVTALAVHRQLVADGHVADSASALLTAQDAIKTGMADLEEHHASVTGRPMPAVLRKKALGQVASVLIDGVRAKRAEQAARKKLEDSLPPGGVVNG